MLAHCGATLAGSMATAALLALLARLAGPLPSGAAGTVALLAALATLAEQHLRLPGSTWMVPRTWGRFGDAGYAAAFGFALGTGVMTLLPSAAWYAVLCAAERAPSWWQTSTVLLAFGAARMLMAPLLTAWSACRGRHPVEAVDAARGVAGRLAPLEAALAAALAMTLLLHT